VTKLRLPDRAVLADLRHAMVIHDAAERDTWLAIAVPDVDPGEAAELLYTAQYAHVARRGVVAERRLHELLELQREAERRAAQQEHAG
jgi:hypothetical protein